MADVYPFFDFESIKNRCNKDLIKFVDDQQINLQVLCNMKTNCDLINVDSKNEMQEQITKILDSMKTIKGNPQLSENYIEMLKNETDDDKKQKLWIVRTYLFYQILTFATAMFLDEKLHKDVYDGNTNAEELVQLAFIDIKEDLKNYKMGIFGSMSPSSDIDIGIQYSGQLKNTALAFIVSTIENLFLIFTGVESLDFDIETYADMLTIPNSDQLDTNHPDIFYLNTSKLTEDDLATFLPIAGNSIVRNVYLAKNGTPTTEDLSELTFDKILTELKYPLGDKTELDEKVTETQTELSKDINNKEKKAAHYAATHAVTIYNFFSDAKNLTPFTKDDAWLNQSKEAVAKFMKETKKERRKMYYDAVLAAETAKNDYLKLDENDKPLKMIELLVFIGTALTYRMESYTCASTVYHVVRTMQAKTAAVPVAEEVAAPGKVVAPVAEEVAAPVAEDTPQKYPTNLIECPDNSTKVVCVIGKVGFQLSLLEQIGYIYRFHLEYCINNKNAEKCDKKKTKYTTRLVNAIKKITAIVPKGGKRKQRTKKRNNKTKKRKSRRYKHRN